MALIEMDRLPFTVLKNGWIFPWLANCECHNQMVFYKSTSLDANFFPRLRVFRGTVIFGDFGWKQVQQAMNQPWAGCLQDLPAVPGAFLICNAFSPEDGSHMAMWWSSLYGAIAVLYPYSAPKMGLSENSVPHCTQWFC